MLPFSRVCASASSPADSFGSLTPPQVLVSSFCVAAAFSLLHFKTNKKGEQKEEEVSLNHGNQMNGEYEDYKHKHKIGITAENRW